MKTTGILLAASSFLFGALTAAGPVEKRFGGTVQIVEAVNQVTAGVNSLDAVVDQVNSANLTQLLAVQSAANVLTSTISGAQSEVQAAPNLDVIGSLAVEVAATQLVSAVQKLSNDLIKIEPFVEQAGVTSTVESTLESQKSSADDFADVLLSKVPVLLQGIAGVSKTQIDNALDKAIQAYS